ncbi:mechanosensitive ion channel family protein [Tenggerimyces flavus]|uniref:Mechanosensitive ion channel family protein n=1 Tax=Tenggerimyces flavus TaxID=1708749 RepID=A0ABV7YME2_9ACTN|nr:mechanosensitive ion channel family protein [Tenggerimyces flavus]MBM7789511.1 small conductance mechanosensitive channel [Tenggerimyces flavus]
MNAALDWQFWANSLEVPGKIALVIVLGVVIRLLVHRAIRRLVRRTVGLTAPDRLLGSKTAAAIVNHAGLANERRRQRAEALGSLFESITTVVVSTVVVLMVLGLLQFDLAPLLASAGVVGVALGFGAQNLVKDFLSGVFMLLEDQYGIGDVIDMGEAVGTVEGVGLRTTRLRDGDGVLWHVRNGEVLRVGNKSQGWSTLLLDVDVAYDENTERVEDLINTVAAALATEEDWAGKVIEAPKVVGIEGVSGLAVTLRVIGKCTANEHFSVQRELRQRLKDAFAVEGIRVPQPVPWSGPGQPPA